MARTRSFTPLRGLLFIAALAAACLAVAGTGRADDRNQVAEPDYGTAPVFEQGTWSTANDNAGTGCTGTADGDLHTSCMYNTDAKAPIEFNINVGSVKATSYVLRVSAWDVDNVDGEVDVVWLNGQQLGSLTGTGGAWSVTTFNVPANLVVAGNNCVRIDIDTANVGLFCTAVNYGSLFAQQTDVPGLNPYGLLAATLLLLAAGIWTVRRRRVYEA